VALDRYLGVADLTIRNNEIARLAENLLDSHVTVSEARASYGSERRLSVLLELKNTGSQPIQIGYVEFKVLAKALPADWDNIRRRTLPPAPTAPAPSAWLPTTAEARTAAATTGLGDFGVSESAPQGNRVGLINKYSDQHDGWIQLHVWKYDPKEQAGDERAGIILVGQVRHIE
jgi:hypothetical protein